MLGPSSSVCLNFAYIICVVDIDLDYVWTFWNYTLRFFNEGDSAIAHPFNKVERNTKIPISFWDCCEVDGNLFATEPQTKINNVLCESKSIKKIYVRTKRDNHLNYKEDETF